MEQISTTDGLAEAERGLHGFGSNANRKTRNEIRATNTSNKIGTCLFCVVLQRVAKGSGFHRVAPESEGGKLNVRRN